MKAELVKLKVLTSCFLFGVSGFLTLAQPLEAADKTGGNLVNAGWLEQNLKNPEVLILDASPAQIYSAKHIPGAISVDVYSWYGLKEMPVADMQKIYQSWGISPGKKIVMYDQGGTMLATRLFYSRPWMPAGILEKLWHSTGPATCLMQ